MTEWISVSDRIPEALPNVYYSRDVLFLTEDNIMYVGVCRQYDYKSTATIEWEENSLSCGCCWKPPKVLWWAELPEGPK